MFAILDTVEARLYQLVGIAIHVARELDTGKEGAEFYRHCAAISADGMILGRAMRDALREERG